MLIDAFCSGTVHCFAFVGRVGRGQRCMQYWEQPDHSRQQSKVRMLGQAQQDPRRRFYACLLVMDDDGSTNVEFQQAALSPRFNGACVY